MVRLMTDLANANSIPLDSIVAYGITAAGPLELKAPKILENFGESIKDSTNKERFINEHPGLVLQHVDAKIICEQAKNFDRIALRVIMDAQVALGNVLHQMAVQPQRHHILWLCYCE